MKEKIKDSIIKSINTKQLIFNNSALLDLIEVSCQTIIKMYRNQGTFFVAGNGGSASDAQALVAQLNGRYKNNRTPLSAFALTTNSSTLTCIGNDFGFEHVFSRQIEASGRRGDVFLAISTSGNSKNIVNAAKLAKQKGLTVIGLTGEQGGYLAEYCDYMLKVPAKDTARIQECHVLVCHILAEIVEAELFPNEVLL